MHVNDVPHILCLQLHGGLGVAVHGFVLLNASEWIWLLCGAHNHFLNSLGSKQHLSRDLRVLLKYVDVKSGVCLSQCVLPWEATTGNATHLPVEM